MNEEFITTQLSTMQEELMNLRTTVAHQNDEISRLRFLVEDQNERITQFEARQSSQGVLHVLPTREPKVADPEYFTGNRKKAKQFLLQLQNIFMAQPSSFTNDRAKLAYTISFLRGPAFIWIAPYIESQHCMLNDINQFQDLFLLAFGDVDRAQEVEREILKIRQGNRSAAVLVSEFQRLALESKWPDSVLYSLFYQALNDTLKDEICKSDRPNSMDEYYKLAVRIDNRLSERSHERRRLPTLGQQTFTPLKEKFHDPDAMVIASSRFTPKSKANNTPPQEFQKQKFKSNSPKSNCSGSEEDSRSRGFLTEEEKNHRRINNLCRYCGSNNHQISTCPRIPKNSMAHH